MQQLDNTCMCKVMGSLFPSRTRHAHEPQPKMNVCVVCVCVCVCVLCSVSDLCVCEWDACTGYILARQ